MKLRKSGMNRLPHELLSPLTFIDSQMSFPQEVNSILAKLRDPGRPLEARQADCEALMELFETEESLRESLAQELRRIFLSSEREMQRFIVELLLEFPNEPSLERLMRLAEESADSQILSRARSWQRVHQAPNAELTELHRFLADDPALDLPSSPSRLHGLLQRLPCSEIENAVIALTEVAVEYPQLLVCADRLSEDKGYHQFIIDSLEILKPDRVSEYLFECFRKEDSTFEEDTSTFEAAVKLLLHAPYGVEVFAKAADNGNRYDLLFAITEILSRISADETLLSYLAFVANQIDELSPSLKEHAFDATKNHLKPLQNAELSASQEGELPCSQCEASVSVGKVYLVGNDLWCNHCYNIPIFHVLRCAPQIFKPDGIYLTPLLNELQTPLQAIPDPSETFTRRQGGIKAGHGLITLLNWEAKQSSDSILIRLFRRFESFESRQLLQWILNRIKQTDKFGIPAPLQSGLEGVFSLLFVPYETAPALENIKSQLKQILSSPSMFNGGEGYLQVLEATLELLNSTLPKSGLNAYKKALESIPQSINGLDPYKREIIDPLPHYETSDVAIGFLDEKMKEKRLGSFFQSLLSIIRIYLSQPNIPLALHLAQVFSPKGHQDYHEGLQRLTHYQDRYFRTLIDCCANALTEWDQLDENGLDLATYGSFIFQYIEECQSYQESGGTGKFPDPIYIKEQFRIPLDVLFRAPESQYIYRAFIKLLPVPQTMLPSYLEANYRRQMSNLQSFQDYLTDPQSDHPSSHKLIVLECLDSPPNPSNDFVRLTDFLSSYLYADVKENPAELAYQIRRVYEAILSLPNYAQERGIAFNCSERDLKEVTYKLPRRIYYECTLWHKALQAMIDGISEHSGAQRIEVRLKVTETETDRRIRIQIGDDGHGWVDEQENAKGLEEIFEMWGQELKFFCEIFKKYCSSFTVEECHFKDKTHTEYEIHAYDILVNQPIKRNTSLIPSFDPLCTGKGGAQTGTIYTLEIPVWPL